MFGILVFAPPASSVVSVSVEGGLAGGRFDRLQTTEFRVVANVAAIEEVDRIEVTIATTAPGFGASQSIASIDPTSSQPSGEVDLGTPVSFLSAARCNFEELAIGYGPARGGATIRCEFTLDLPGFGLGVPEAGFELSAAVITRAGSSGYQPAPATIGPSPTTATAAVEPPRINDPVQATPPTTTATATLSPATVSPAVPPARSDEVRMTSAPVEFTVYNLAPVPRLEPLSRLATAGAPLEFSVLASDPDRPITQSTWELAFGDGASTNGGFPVGTQPSHAYATSGEFRASIDVTDADGGVGSVTSLALIGDACLPVVEFVTIDGRPLGDLAPPEGSTDRTGAQAEVRVRHAGASCPISLNEAPTLSGTGVDPGFGMPGDDFTYFVWYQDPEGDAPNSITVRLDGQAHRLEAIEPGADVRLGAVYGSQPLTLSSKPASVEFRANDGISDAESLPGPLGPVFGEPLRGSVQLPNPVNRQVVTGPVEDLLPELLPPLYALDPSLNGRDSYVFALPTQVQGAGLFGFTLTAEELPPQDGLPELAADFDICFYSADPRAAAVLTERLACFAGAGPEKGAIPLGATWANVWADTLRPTTALEEATFLFGYQVRAALTQPVLPPAGGPGQVRVWLDVDGDCFVPGGCSFTPGIDRALQTIGGIPARLAPRTLDPIALTLDQGDRNYRFAAEYDNGLTPRPGLGAAVDYDTVQVQRFINDKPTVILSAPSPAVVPPAGGMVSVAATVFDPDDAESGIAPQQGGLASWSLDFGDGTAAVTGTTALAATAFEHPYVDPGQYTIRLTATDELGLSNFTTRQLRVNAAPVAVLAAEVGQGVDDHRATFTMSASDADGGIAGFVLDFGDGSEPLTGTGLPPSTSQHVYASPDNYQASLTVVDDNGATGTDSVDVAIQVPANDIPVPDLQADPVEGQAPLSVTFTISIEDQDAADPITWDLDFGDGSSLVDQNGRSASVSHTYTGNGVFGARLTAEDGKASGPASEVSITVLAPDQDDDGVPDSEDNCAAVSNPEQSDLDEDGLGDACDPDLDGDAVDNDEDNCPEAPNPSQADADSDGLGDACDPTPTPTPEPNHAPIADLAGDPVSGNAPLTVDFTITISDADASDSISWTLDFDDGTSQTGTGRAATRQHVYSTSGSYVALLTASDGEDTDTDEVSILVGMPDQDEDGIADGEDNCVAIANPQQEDLDEDGEGDPCDEDRDGDGVTNGTDNCPEDPNPTQQDSDEDGVGDACDPTPSPTPGPNHSPIAGLSAEPVSGQAPLTVEFSITVTDADAADAITWTLDFGEGEPITGTGRTATPSHEYVVAGSYMAVLTATDGEDSDSDQVSITVDVADQDEDGVADADDNCVDVPNADQEDADEDGQGDSCDADRDGDGVPNSTDNCPDDANAAQADNDDDGIGNPCDPSPNPSQQPTQRPTPTPPTPGGGPPTTTSTTPTASTSPSTPTSPSTSSTRPRPPTTHAAPSSPTGQEQSTATTAPESATSPAPTETSAATSATVTYAVPPETQAFFVEDVRAEQQPSGAVLITWSPPQDEQVGGFLVFRSASPFTLIARVEDPNATGFLDATAVTGNVYQYAVTFFREGGEGLDETVSAIQGLPAEARLPAVTSIGTRSTAGRTQSSSDDGNPWPFLGLIAVLVVAGLIALLVYLGSERQRLVVVPAAPETPAPKAAAKDAASAQSQATPGRPTSGPPPRRD